MAETLTIQKVIARITSGDIRIPAFQRDFVWDADRVAFLLDSIYKGFPIGTIVLWKTDKKLTTEKNLGYFELPEPRKDYPVNYVLDGQQRLTSLFSVFQTTLTPNSEEWTDIYFDLDADLSIQESAFIALDEEEVDNSRHFPVKTFFDSVAYRKAATSLDDKKLTKIDEVSRKFWSYIIPDVVFETDDMNKVAIVFERINRAGTELNRKGSKPEYHHIFPKKHLEGLGKTKREVNCLANICFLTRSDNNLIKDNPPSIYGSRMTNSTKSNYLKKALVPFDFDTIDYEVFLEKRNELLMNFAKELMK